MSDYSNIIILAEELLDEGLSIKTIVGGNSMFPFLRNGNTVIIKKVPIPYLKTGDIIVFKSNNKLVAHRIIFKRKQKSDFKIFTKGDARLLFDKPLTAKNYIGRVNPATAKKTEILNFIIAMVSIISIPFFIFLIPLSLFASFKKSYLKLNR